jgi:hypothetical protein
MPPLSLPLKDPERGRSAIPDIVRDRRVGSSGVLVRNPVLKIAIAIFFLPFPGERNSDRI